MPSASLAMVKVFPTHPRVDELTIAHGIVHSLVSGVHGRRSNGLSILSRGLIS